MSLIMRLHSYYWTIFTWNSKMWKPRWRKNFICLPLPLNVPDHSNTIIFPITGHIHWSSIENHQRGDDINMFKTNVKPGNYKHVSDFWQKNKKIKIIINILLLFFTKVVHKTLIIEYRACSIPRLEVPTHFPFTALNYIETNSKRLSSSRSPPSNSKTDFTTTRRCGSEGFCVRRCCSCLADVY